MGGNTIGDVIEVPCRLSMKISGLIIQQQCRTAKEWDKTDSITFNERVFNKSFFGDSIYAPDTNLSDSELTSDRIIKTEWFKFQPKVIGAGRETNDDQTGWYGTVNTNGLTLKWINFDGNTQNTSDYCIIGKSLNVLSKSDVSLGGKYYYNDFQSMKVLQNSVKTWKTFFQDTKFNGFTIYGDYSPNERIIGEPYLNTDSVIHLYEAYSDNNGHLIENDYSAAVVKTAKDLKNVNNVTNVNEILEGVPEIKLKHYGFDFIDNSIYQITNTISTAKFSFYGILDLENLERGGYVELTIDPNHISNLSNLDIMNFKVVNPRIYNTQGEMKIRGTYLFLNGFPNTQQDVLWDVNAQTTNNSRNMFDFGNNVIGYITSIRSSDIILTDEGIISGYINYDFIRSLNADNSMEEIEVHHVNLPAPILTNIGVSFTDEQKENLDKDGYYPINDNIWKREVAFNSDACASVDLLSRVKNINSLRLYSSMIPNQSINGKLTPLFDDDNELSGFFIELKFNKISTFNKAELKMYIDNQKNVIINNEETLSSYHENIGLSKYSIETIGNTPDEYNKDAKIGDTVISGTVQAAYNYVKTEGIKLDYNYKDSSSKVLYKNTVNGGIPGVGYVKHTFNPIDNNLFQLEVITKAAGEEFEKTLYYVNKPVNQWYNLSLYRYNKTNEAGNDQTSKIGFVLSNVNEENINDITSRSEEIFNCQVTNETILDGKELKFDLLNNQSSRYWFNTLFGSSSKLNLYKWKSLYNIEFEKCGRSHWNCKYSDDPKNLANENYYITETEYNKKSRKNVDLFNIGNSSFSTIKSKFKNRYGFIKLFANKELESELSRGINETIEGSQVESIGSIGRPAFYNLYISKFGKSDGFSTLIDADGNLNNLYNSDFGNKLNISEYTLLKNDSNNSINNYLDGPSSIFELLFKNYPSKISFNDNYDNSIVKYKTERELFPIIRSTEIEAKNIMIVMSPNLSYVKDKNINSDPYSSCNSYRESLNAVNEYVEFFGNPQHRMPPVSYSNLLLSSEYATFIYNNCESYNAIDFSNLYTDTEILVKNFENNPLTIAYVWGNSKVTRTEHLYNGSIKNTKLIWNQINNNECICELGSIYNYFDSNTTTSTTSLTVGSIVDRQCSMMPVLTSPFDYEKRSKESGLIKVNDTIIATAALGYNSSGLPINSILTYNDERGIEIDSTNRQYIYLSQNTDTSCKLNATVQKPVFVDSVTFNKESLSENYDFLPNPTISIRLNENEDSGLKTIQGVDDFKQNLASVETVGKFLFGNDITSETIPDNFICYSNAVKITDKTNSLQFYRYYHKNDKNQLGNNIETISESESDSIPNILYVGNIFAFPYMTSQNTINKDGLNVFYDENDQSMLEDMLADIDFNIENIKLNTFPCFNYEGYLCDPKDIQEYVYSHAYDGQNYTFYRDYINNYISSVKELKENNNVDLDIAPEFGIIWKSDLTINDPLIYKESMNYDLSKFINGRTCIFDEYFGVNLSSVRFKFDVNEISSAPIYIKIFILKYDSNKNKFKWINDESLDFDNRYSYENDYKYTMGESIYLTKVFINDSTNLTKNVYGIKFRIMQIIPQSETFASCKISKIKIYASNILNPNGFSRTVQDTYVNKSESLYENSYNFNCSEYVWRLPNSAGEWQAVLNDLKNRKADKELLGFEDQGYDVISGRIQNIINNESNNSINTITVDENNKLNISKGGKNLSVVASYYIAPDANAGKDVTEVLSDNYLVDSDISISWKYIDYVYISYSCNSFNARELLDIYFGNKIFEAVKAKLNANIANLNATNDKYHFSGGIAVTKSNERREITNTKAFEWRQNINVTTINQYEDTYRTDTTTITSYNLDTWDRYYYDHYTDYASYHTDSNRGSWDTIKVTGSHDELNRIERMGEVKQTSSTTTSNTVKTSHKLVKSSSSEQYVGQTLQSVKYSSVDNWVAEFGPTEIKYRIN